MKTLLERMARQGLTPESLAARMQGQGYSVSAWSVNAYVSGRRIPPIRAARALANALDCTVDDIADAVIAEKT
jgi:transcriptional regulator with XRE-family HTH domain